MQYPLLEGALNDIAIIRTTFETLDLFFFEDSIRADAKTSVATWVMSYLQSARDIVTGRASCFPTHTVRNRDVLLYSTATNEFDILGGNVIRTLYKPVRGYQYWPGQLTH